VRTTTLEGHVALVTGAGRGIGRAHALLMAERGARVVVSDIGVGLDGIGRDSSVAEGVADEIVQAGGHAVADTNDISSFEGAAAAVQTAVRAFGKVDIVVNNAGLAGGSAIAACAAAFCGCWFILTVVCGAGISPNSSASSSSLSSRKSDT